MKSVERSAFSVERGGDPALNAQPSTLNPRLRWRARRGMLENDLILTRFLDRHESRLTPAQTAALIQLLDLPDTELFDLLMARSEPAPPLDQADVRAVLTLLRTA